MLGASADDAEYLAGFFLDLGVQVIPAAIIRTKRQ
jgi:hypothetical protein